MADKRPNIIFVICHDLGKHLNCYGAEGVPSPNLDRFAADGVLFTNTFCSSPCCSPSRGCALSGQYAHTNGLMGLVNQGWSMPEGTRTVADYFNAAGYETAHFGFQHERYVAAANRYQIEGAAPYPEDDWRNREEDWVDRVVPKAIAYLESRAASERPFFLNVGTMEVHSSRWQGGNHYPAGNPQHRSEAYGADPPEQAYMPPYISDVPQLRELMGRFQGAIRFFDSHIQRLFDAVERLGLAENTLILFTTDHGIANMRSKGWLYDRGVEIALMMQMPGTIGQGIKIDHLIQNIDLAPTMLDAAGIEVPESMQGRSFWPLLIGGDYAPHEAIVTERNWHGNWDPTRAVRTRRYHYIRSFGEDPKKPWLPGQEPYLKTSFEDWFTEIWPPLIEPRPAEELFDVQADPDEFVDLAQNAEHTAIRQELAAYLDRWMVETDDPILHGPVPNLQHAWPSIEKARGDGP